MVYWRRFLLLHPTTRLGVALAVALLFTIGMVWLHKPEPTAEPHAATSGEPLSITVLAASSLTQFVNQVIQPYARAHNTSVSASFESPSELAARIATGEPADIIIMDDADMMQQLKQQGLVDVFSIMNMATDHLVLVAGNDNRAREKIPANADAKQALEILVKHNLLVLPDPAADHTGALAKQTLEFYGLWEKLQPYIIRAANSQQALYMIAKGNLAGIVYSGDIAGSGDVTRLAPIPDDTHTIPTYQAAVVAGENMEKARNFLEFLKQDSSQQQLRAAGLTPMMTPAAGL